MARIIITRHASSSLGERTFSSGLTDLSAEQFRIKRRTYDTIRCNFLNEPLWSMLYRKSLLIVIGRTMVVFLFLSRSVEPWRFGRNFAGQYSCFPCRNSGPKNHKWHSDRAFAVRPLDRTSAGLSFELTCGYCSGEFNVRICDILLPPNIWNDMIVNLSMIVQLPNPSTETLVNPLFAYPFEDDMIVLQLEVQRIVLISAVFVFWEVLYGILHIIVAL